MVLSLECSGREKDCGKTLLLRKEDMGKGVLPLLYDGIVSLYWSC